MPATPHQDDEAARRLARRVDVMDKANRHLYELRGDPALPKGPDNPFPYHDPVVLPEDPFAPRPLEPVHPALAALRHTKL